MIGPASHLSCTFSQIDPAVVTRGELLRWAIVELRAAKIPSAEREAVWLVQHALGVKELELRVSHDTRVGCRDVDRTLDLIRRRAAHEPLQYLLGSQEIAGLELTVTPAVLIPRADTEVLIDAVCRELAAHRAPVVADVGTGSGCIAVSIATRLPGALVHAVDVSRQALEVARHNAERHRVASRIVFYEGELCRPLFAAELHGRLSAVVSNPPYIPAGEISLLQEEVQREPRIALSGGPDGLTFYRRLLPEALSLLEPQGCVAFEVGQGQAAAVCRLAEATGNYYNIETVKDEQGIERVVLAWKTR